MEWRKELLRVVLSEMRMEIKEDHIAVTCLLEERRVEEKEA